MIAVSNKLLIDQKLRKSHLKTLDIRHFKIINSSYLILAHQSEREIYKIKTKRPLKQ